MADDKQAGVKGAQASEEQPDGRLLAVVTAMVPAVGEAPPTEEQKKLALELGKLVEGAQKKAADKAAHGK